MYQVANMNYDLHYQFNNELNLVQYLQSATMQ